MKKLPMLIGAGLLSATLATATLAGPKGDCRHGGERWHQGEKILNQLNLSAEQKTAIESLRAQHRDQKKAQREMRKSQAMFPPTPDQADYDTQVQAYAQQKADAMEAKIIEKARMKAEIYALLTPEQQSKMLELRSEMKEKRREKMREYRQERREAREQNDV